MWGGEVVLVVVINVEMEGAISPCTDGVSEAQNMNVPSLGGKLWQSQEQTSHSTTKSQQISLESGQGKDHRDQLWAVSAYSEDEECHLTPSGLS